MNTMEASEERVRDVSLSADGHGREWGKMGSAVILVAGLALSGPMNRMASGAFGGQSSAGSWRGPKGGLSRQVLWDESDAVRAKRHMLPRVLRPGRLLSEICDACVWILPGKRSC